MRQKLPNQSVPYWRKMEGRDLLRRLLELYSIPRLEARIIQDTCMHLHEDMLAFSHSLVLSLSSASLPATAIRQSAFHDLIFN